LILSLDNFAFHIKDIISHLSIFANVLVDSISGSVEVLKIIFYLIASRSHLLLWRCLLLGHTSSYHHIHSAVVHRWHTLCEGLLCWRLVINHDSEPLFEIFLHIDAAAFK